MVPALVFFTALAASAFGHHIALVPIGTSPAARWFTPVTAASPYAASMGLAGGLSAAEASRTLAGINAASAQHAFLADSPAATFPSSGSAADAAGRAAEALDAAAFFESAATSPSSLAVLKAIEAGAPATMMVPVSSASSFGAFKTIGAACADPVSCGYDAAAPGSLAHALAAAKSIEAGAPASMMVPVSAASPFAAMRAIGAACADPASCGLAAAPGSLAHALAAAKSAEAGAPAAVMVPVSAASPLVVLRAISAAADAAAPGSLAHALAAAQAMEDADPSGVLCGLSPISAASPAGATFSPVSAANPWAATRGISAASPAGAVYFTAPSAAGAMDASDLAAAVYGSSAAAKHANSYLSDDTIIDRASYASPLIRALAAGKVKASPISPWVVDAPESATAKLAKGYSVIPTAGAWSSWSA